MNLIIWTSDNAEVVQKEIAPQINGSDVSYTLAYVYHDLILPDTTPDTLVVAMGTEALVQLGKLQVVPKNRTITSLRPPHAFKLASGAQVLVTYTASMVNYDYAKYIDVLVDLSMAVRLVKTGSLAPQVGKYRYVSSFTDVIDDIRAQFEATGRSVKVGLDTETLGLDPYDPAAYIVSIQVSCRKGTADLLYFSSQKHMQLRLTSSSVLWYQLKWLLTTPMVSLRAANGKYDLNWIWVCCAIDCTNFRFDTMLVGSLVDENRSNSLKLHAKLYSDMGGYEEGLESKYKKSRMDLVPPDDLLIYAGGDADVLLTVADREQMELLSDPKLAKFYINILHPAARAYEHVERCGVMVDVPYYLQLEHEVKTEQAQLHKEAKKLLGGRLVAKHMFNLNLTKPALLKDFFFSPSGLKLKPKMFTDKAPEDTTDWQYASTAMDHLKMFMGNPKAQPFIQVLRAWQECQKTLSTYICKRDATGKIVGGFLSHLRADGRFHPNFYLAKGGTETDEETGGTNTGRSSCKDPALQTLTKRGRWAKALRRAIIAPPGMVIMAHDYAQGELKIAACVANEEKMIDAYRSGIDLHSITAAELSGMTLEQLMKLQETDEKKFDDIRYLGKAGNFGLIYKMSANGFEHGELGGFRAYALYNYNLVLSEKKAQAIHDRFFRLYPGLAPWHKRCMKFARENGYMRSPLGRVRHLPLIFSANSQVRSKAARQAINAPVQATLSDMTFWATALFHKAGWFETTPSIGMVHDQSLAYVPEGKAVQYAARNKYLMENLPFKRMGWSPQLTFTVDAEIGPNLGELKKLKSLSYDDAGDLLASAKLALA